MKFAVNLIGGSFMVIDRVAKTAVEFRRLP
jgi:hypothetical protein